MIALRYLCYHNRDFPSWQYWTSLDATSSTTHEPLTMEADTLRVCWQTSQLHHSDKSLPGQNAAFTTVPGKPILLWMGCKIVIPCCLGLVWDLSLLSLGLCPRASLDKSHTTLTAIVYTQHRTIALLHTMIKP